MTFSLVAFLCCGAPARAQIMVFANPSSAKPDEKAREGFSVPTEEALTNSFADFERHVEKKSWEKAFAALAEIPTEKRKGMLARPDGVVIPASQRIWDSIAALPAEGRDAFRLFNEAKAKQLWGTINDSIPWKERVETAERIYQEFFLTSVGDNAADFLGDVAFERGDSESAEQYFRAVLEKHPDSDVPELRLLFKRGLALAQMKQAAGVATVNKAIEQRYPKATTKVAGREVDPRAYLEERLKAPDPSTAAATTTATTARIESAPADDVQPIWRTQFLSDKAVKQRDNSMRNYYYYRNGMETVVPNIAVDGNKLFCNWFGILFAFDSTSGKLLWRTSKFSDLTQHFQSMPHSALNMESFRIAFGEGLVIGSAVPADRLNSYQEPTRLLCVDATTGKEKWKTTEGVFANVSFLGTPIIREKEILSLGHGRGDAKMSLYCLDLEGKQKWVTELGALRKRTTNSGYEKMPQPALVCRGKSAYIATEDGALLGFDLGEHRLRWMLPYNAPQVSTSNRMFFDGSVEDRVQLHTETKIFDQDGLLYVKEAGGRELVAIDPTIPSIVWRRPAEASSQIVSVDRDSIYLMDRELQCIDRQNHTLRWATLLPVDDGGLSILPGKDVILVLTGRGVFELDRTKGKVKRIFRGADLAAGGGRLAIVGQQLIAVTTQSVTSYGNAGIEAAGSQ